MDYFKIIEAGLSIVLDVVQAADQNDAQRQFQAAFPDYSGYYRIVETSRSDYLSFNFGE